MIWAAITLLAAVIAILAALRASRLETDVAQLRAWHSIDRRDIAQLEHELKQIHLRLGLERTLADE